MSHAVARSVSSAAPQRAHALSAHRAVALIVAAAAMGVAVLSSWPDARDLAVQPTDAELIMLLRFMAVVKAALALAALGVSAWRLGHPASPALTLGYTLAPALMVAAPIVIWQMAHVALGAALFHGGFVVVLLALYADRGESTELAKAATLRLRRAQPEFTSASPAAPR
ncbi:hypothetical protein LPW26_17355 [Rhodopseudomonas sp. HC1]|uniref:hypothetical protein n=1 Tax=Rhodopseudomonas infernalis TaxID=2897386 RepID=UPI001EE97EB8|nr:hypothetical protein [Rhodopseudomonas infernalis]MCG6206418.1 hypothetical protein [Rhodopseudomonas infernalis]